MVVDLAIHGNVVSDVLGVFVAKKRLRTSLSQMLGFFSFGMLSSCHGLERRVLAMLSVRAKYSFTDSPAFM